MTDLASHYLEEMKRQFRGHKRMGEAAMAQLEDKDFFVALDPESNSVAALVKHIAGMRAPALPTSSPPMARNRTVFAIRNLKSR